MCVLVCGCTQACMHCGVHKRTLRGEVNRCKVNLMTNDAELKINCCTLMGFVVATESALRPRAYFSLRALAHCLEREVRSDRQVFQLGLVGIFSAQHFTTRFVSVR